MAENESYYRDVIPAGSYTGQIGAVPTIGVKCLLCVNETMSDETAYRLTEILWNSRESWPRRTPAWKKCWKRILCAKTCPFRCTRQPKNSIKNTSCFEQPKPKPPAQHLLRRRLLV